MKSDFFFSVQSEFVFVRFIEIIKIYGIFVFAQMPSQRLRKNLHTIHLFIYASDECDIKTKQYNTTNYTLRLNLMKTMQFLCCLYVLCVLCMCALCYLKYVRLNEMAWSEPINIVLNLIWNSSLKIVLEMYRNARARSLLNRCLCAKRKSMCHMF